MLITNNMSLSQLKEGIQYFQKWVDKKDPITIDAPEKPVIIANHPAYSNQLSPIVFDETSVKQLFLMHRKHQTESQDEMTTLYENEETLVMLSSFYPDDPALQNDLYEVGSRLHTLQNFAKQSAPFCPITKEALSASDTIVQPIHHFVNPFLGVAAHKITTEVDTFGSLEEPKENIVHDFLALMKALPPQTLEQAANDDTLMPSIHSVQAQAEHFCQDPENYIQNHQLQTWQVELLNRFGLPKTAASGPKPA